MGRNKGNNKRTKSQASPDSVSENQAKRPVQSDRSLIDQNPENMSSSQGAVSQGTLSQQLPYSYCTSPGYVNPQMPYYSMTPLSPVSQVQQPPMQIPQQSDFERTVLSKLANLETCLPKLASIENKLCDMAKNMTLLDNRVSSLESSVHTCNGKLQDIEVSRELDSKVCDDLRSKQVSIDSMLKDESTRIQKLTADYETLKNTNSSLTEEIVDLQSRSMRDNLLFFGIPESSTVEGRRSENCTGLIINHLVNTFKLTDAGERIKIDRAHRIGTFSQNKTRPVVVKFNFYPDKMLVKQHARDTLKADPNCKIRVSDQFPRAVQEKRKQLMPTLVAAKAANKSVSLSYDKLYIEGKMYTVDTVSRAGFANK